MACQWEQRLLTAAIACHIPLSQGWALAIIDTSFMPRYMYNLPLDSRPAAEEDKNWSYKSGALVSGL